jgi:hypothetical protein
MRIACLAPAASALRRSILGILLVWRIWKGLVAHPVGELARSTSTAQPRTRSVCDPSSLIERIRPSDTIDGATADRLKLRSLRALNEQQFERGRQWLGSTGW